MPEHSTKLYYFPLRGRGETARLLLNYNGVKYEDVKIAMEQWPTVKEKMPMGQLPVLEVDGKQICQSTAIARYIAREGGLLGKGSWEMARADMLVEGVFEMWGHLNKVYMPKLQGDMKTSEENWKTFVTEHLTPLLNRYQKFFDENGTGWFVGSALTWADIAVAEFISVLEECFNPTAAASYPKLKAFSSKVLSLPQLKDYVKSRPATPL